MYYTEGFPVKQATYQANCWLQGLYNVQKLKTLSLQNPDDRILVNLLSVIKHIIKLY